VNLRHHIVLSSLTHERDNPEAVSATEAIGSHPRYQYHAFLVPSNHAGPAELVASMSPTPMPTLPVAPATHCSSGWNCSTWHVCATMVRRLHGTCVHVVAEWTMCAECCSNPFGRRRRVWKVVVEPVRGGPMESAQFLVSPPIPPSYAHTFGGHGGVDDCLFGLVMSDQTGVARRRTHTLDY
jgi:hypothetical protein